METQLRVIPQHHIHIECRFCKHTADLAVKVLLEKYDGSTTVSDIVRKARCKNCNRKSEPDFRLIWKIGNGYSEG